MPDPVNVAIRKALPHETLLTGLVRQSLRLIIALVHLEIKPIETHFKCSRTCRSLEKERKHPPPAPDRNPRDFDERQT